MVPFTKLGKLLERAGVCGSTVLFRREHDGSKYFKFIF